MPRKTTALDPERQLMIKAKTCQRLLKEVAYYKEEVKENELKLQEMKSSCSDPYDIKRFEHVLGESYMMVPDSTKRLQQALEDLSSFIQGDDDEIAAALDKAGEWFKTAVHILRDNYGRNDGVVFPETSVEGLAEGEAF